MSDAKTTLAALGGDTSSGGSALPNIPAVPATDNYALNNILSSVKLWIEKASSNGVTGFATKQDLVRMGLIKTDQYGNVISTVDLDLTIPPVPTGLTASGAMTSILVQWNDPTKAYKNHAYAEIWAAEADNFSNVVMVGESSGFVFAHSVGEDTTRYYWIRFVSTAGIKGPFNSLSGTMGQTSKNVQYMLDTLNGALTTSQLTLDLNSRINLIDASNTTPGSVNYRLKATNDALQAQINQLSNTPTYDNATTYNTGQTVQYNGSLYQATSTTVGHLPTDTAYWTKIGDYTSLGAAVADNTAQITAINTVTAGSSSVAAQALYGLQTRMTTAESGITTNATAINNTYTKAQTDSAISGASTSITSAYQSADTATLNSAKTYSDTGSAGALSSAKTYSDGIVATEATTRANADSALSTSISTVSATANAKNKTYSQTTAPASGMTAGDLWFDTDDSNKAYRYNGTSWVAADDTRIASNAAAITTEATARANGDSALSTTISNVSARLDTGGDVSNAIVQSQTTANTAVTNAATAQTTANGKVKTYLQAAAPTGTLVAGDLWLDSDDNNKAYRYSGSAWVAADDVRISTTASAVTTLQTTVSGHTTSISTQATTIDGIQGKYAVKVDNNGYVSGFGLLSTANNGTPTSEFTIVADKFSIAPVATSASAADGSPFYYLTTPTVVDGVTVPAGAYMKTAYIADATITSAKIGSVNADTITTGTLSADRIATNAITADKINGNNLAVVNGTFSGLLQAATGTFSGSLSAATGTFGGSLLAGVVDLAAVIGTTYTYNSGAGTYYTSVPSEKTSLRVTVVGGGGGGAGGSDGGYAPGGPGGGGGGAGAVTTATFNGLTAGATVTVVIGAGGGGGSMSCAWGNPGSSGGASYVYVGGSLYASAAGGGGAPTHDNGAAGPGGAPNGAYGVVGWPGSGGAGGSSAWGSGGAAGVAGTVGQGGTGGPGAGGGGGAGYNADCPPYPYGAGGAGGAGLVILEFYNPNGVVLRTEFNTLQNTVAAQGNQFANYVSNNVGNYNIGSFIVYSGASITAGGYYSLSYAGYPGTWRAMQDASSYYDYSTGAVIGTSAIMQRVS